MVEIDSAVAHACVECGKQFGEGVPPHDGLCMAINHYLDEHGYTLRSVEPRTSTGQEAPWHSTVIRLAPRGTEDPSELERTKRIQCPRSDGVRWCSPCARNLKLEQHMTHDVDHHGYRVLARNPETVQDPEKGRIDLELAVVGTP